MEIKGVCFEVGQTQQVSEKFKKRELILECGDNPQYLEYVKFECGNDKVSLLDSIKKGDAIEVFFNMRGKPYTDKTGKKTYFNSLQLWKVNVL
jgi:hypothetical protein